MLSVMTGLKRSGVKCLVATAGRFSGPPTAEPDYIAPPPAIQKGDKTGDSRNTV